jgi:hypothetical protein
VACSLTPALSRREREFVHAALSLWERVRVREFKNKKGTGVFSAPGMTIVNPSWKKAPMPSGKSDKK